MSIPMSKKVSQSAFGRPWSNDHLVRIQPPLLHVPVYSAGGLKQLHKNIEDGCQDWLQGYGTYTDDKGVFCPKHGMPLLAARYRFLDILGTGQSSVLTVAEDTFNSNAKVSIKVLHTHYCVLGAQEVDCVRKLNAADPEGFSPVIRLQNLFMYDGHYCMVFELLDPKPLTEHFKKIMDKHEKLHAIRKIALQLLQALGFLQQQNVIHADLKPDNILLKNENDFSLLKVVDFGNAITCVHDELSLYYDDFQLQTFLYRAPEVMFGVPFGLEVDVWSVGCILAELYKGETLFAGKTQNKVLTRMTEILGPVPQMYQRGKFFNSLRTFAGRPKDQNEVTLALKQELGTDDYTFADFIRGFLQYDPVCRITVAEAAQHHFMAPQLAIRFLLPQMHGPDKKSGYSGTFLAANSYHYSPVISVDVTKRHLDSVELLRHGTGNNSCTSVPEPQSTSKKVAHLFPGGHLPRCNKQTFVTNLAQQASTQQCSGLKTDLSTEVWLSGSLMSGPCKAECEIADEQSLSSVIKTDTGRMSEGNKMKQDLSKRSHCPAKSFAGPVSIDSSFTNTKGALPERVFDNSQKMNDILAESKQHWACEGVVHKAEITVAECISETRNKNCSVKCPIGVVTENKAERNLFKPDSRLGKVVTKQSSCVEKRKCSTPQLKMEVLDSKENVKKEAVHVTQSFRNVDHQEQNMTRDRDETKHFSSINDVDNCCVNQVAEEKQLAANEFDRKSLHDVHHKSTNLSSESINLGGSTKNVKCIDGIASLIHASKCSAKSLHNRIYREHGQQKKYHAVLHDHVISHENKEQKLTVKKPWQDLEGSSSDSYADVLSDASGEDLRYLAHNSKCYLSKNSSKYHSVESGVHVDHSLARHEQHSNESHKVTYSGEGQQSGKHGSNVNVYDKLVTGEQQPVSILTKHNSEVSKSVRHDKRMSSSYDRQRKRTKTTNIKNKPASKRANADDSSCGIDIKLDPYCYDDDDDSGVEQRPRCRYKKRISKCNRRSRKPDAAVHTKKVVEENTDSDLSSYSDDVLLL